jgi:hypothetical protein
LIRENEALLRTLDIPIIYNKSTTSSSNITALRKHKPVKKKEPQLPVRVSARIRGEPPSENKRALDIDNGQDVEQAKKLKTIDSLDEKDQANMLNIFSKLVPNTKPPKQLIKQEVDDEGKTPDQVLENKYMDLKIQHTWTTVKVTPHRINSCL